MPVRPQDVVVGRYEHANKRRIFTIACFIFTKVLHSPVPNPPLESPMRHEFGPWKPVEGQRLQCHIDVWDDHGARFEFIAFRSLAHADMQGPSIVGVDLECPVHGPSFLLTAAGRQIESDVQCAMDNGGYEGWVWVFPNDVVPMWESEYQAYMYAAERIADHPVNG